MRSKNCPLVVKYKLEKHIGDFVEVDSSSYKGCQSPLRIIDKEFGEYYTTYNRAMRQKGLHPKRVSILKKTKNINIKIEEATRRMAELGLEIKEGTYVNFTQKCILIDPEYGEWESTPCSIYSRKGSHPLKANKLQCKDRILSECYINSNLKKDRPFISIKSGTYVNSNLPATFIDEDYGEWTAKFINVYYNKSNHPDRGQHNKARSVNRRAEYIHWRTGQNIVAVGSYECFVVELLNKNCIDFHWQVPKKLSNGKTYYVDLYLPEYNLYIEIKGQVRLDWVEKWDLFTKEFYGGKYILDYNEMKKLGYSSHKHQNIYFKK